MSFPSVNDNSGFTPYPSKNIDISPATPKVFISSQRETPLSLDEIHLLSQEIEQYSQLNQVKPPTDLQVKPPDLLGTKGEIKDGLKESPLFLNLAHLFAHPWLNLPGVKPPVLLNAIQLAKALFSKEPKASAIFNKLEVVTQRITATEQALKELTTGKEIAHTIQQAALVTANEVKALKPQEQYYIPIQFYQDKTPHPILVSLKRKDTDNFDITLWSPNENVSAYQNSQIDNAEEKIRPVITFNNISSNALFFDDDGVIRTDFFEALLQTSLVGKPDLKFVFEGIFRRFWPNYNQKPTEANFISPQKAYESNWNLLKAIGYQSFEDKKDYKVTKIRFLHKALVEAWFNSQPDLSNPSSGADDCRQVLRDAAKHLQKLAFKAYEKGQIDETEVKQIRVTAQDIIERIDKINHEISLQRKATQTPIETQAVSLNTHRYKSISTIQSISIKRPWVSTVPATTPLFTVVEFVIPSVPASVPEALKVTLARIDAKAIAETPLAVMSQIEQIVNTFKLEDSYWRSEFDAKEIEAILGYMDQLGNHYEKAVLTRAGLTQNKHSAVFDKLYALSHMLALIYDAKSPEKTTLENYLVHYGSAATNIVDLEFDPKTADTKRSVRDYFRKYGHSRIEAKLQSSFGDLNHLPGVIFNFTISVSINKSDKIKDDGKFYLELAKEDLSRARDYAKYLSTDSNYNHSTLLNSKFAHIHHLRNAALRSQLFQDQRFLLIADSKDEIYWNCKEQKWNENYYTYTYSLDAKPSNDSNRFNKDPRKLQDFTYKPYTFPWRTYSIGGSRQNIIKDNTSTFYDNKTENDTLVNKYLDFNQPFTYLTSDLLLATAEKELLPFQLIDLYTQNIHKMATSDDQAIFETLFFRSYISKSHPLVKEIDSHYSSNSFLSESAYTPTERLLATEPALQKRCKEFIDQGLERFVELQFKKRPQIDAALFFIRFAGHLHQRQVYDATPFVNTLNQWLELNDLTKDEKFTLHQHRLYLYSILESESIEKSLESWFYINKESSRTDWGHEYLKLTAESYAQKCVEKAIDSFNHKNWETTARQILSSYQLIDPRIPLKIENKYSGIITAITPSGDEWNFHLANGSLKLFEKEITSTPKTSWKKEDIKLAEKILGEIPQSLTYIGDSSRYYSKKLGLLLFPNNAPHHIMHREINGKWYQFQQKKDLSEGNIPEVLLSNNTAWVSLDSPREVIYSSKQTGAPLYIQLNDGKIHPFHNRTISLHPYIPDEKDKGFDLIEDAPYVLVEEDAQGKIVGYNLPRFSARFIVQDNEILLENNPQYALAPLRENNLLLGNNNYLTLINKYDGSNKLLCSNRKIVKSPGTQSARFSKKNPKNASLMMLDYENGLVKPQSISERILLANILLGQGEYLKVNKLLDSIEATETLDYSSVKSLEMIIEYAEEYDASVEAAALGLKATYLLFEKSLTTLRISEKLLLNYYKNIKKLSTLLELPKKTELALFSKITYNKEPLSSIIATRLAYLKKTAPHIHESTLPNISFTKAINILSPLTLGQKDFSTRYGTPEQIKKAQDDLSNTLYNYSFLTRQNISSFTLDDYKQPFLFTKSISEFSDTSTWRKMFYTAYQVARKSTSSKNDKELNAERNRLEFRLQLWETNPSNYKGTIDNDLFSYLQTAIHPNARVPNTITFLEDHYAPKEAEATSIWNFILKLNEVTRQNLELISPELSTNVSDAQDKEWKYNVNNNPSQKIFKESSEKFLHPQDNALTFQLQPSSLKNLREKYIPVLPDPVIPPKIEPEPFSPPQIDQSEEALLEAVQKGFDEFNLDYIEGIAENTKEENKPVEPEINLNLFKDIKGILSEKTADNEKRIINLLNLANKTTSEQQRAKREASFHHSLSLEDLHHLFNQKSRQQYQKANPNLTEDEISQIYKLTSAQMQTSIEIRKLQELQTLGTKLESTNHTETRQNLLREIRALIRPIDEVYDPIQLPTVLVFEYMSKLTPRPKQVELLKLLSELNSAGKFTSRIVQLIMGGGKTAVLSSILLSQMARYGRRAILVVPSEQMGSVKANLRKSQRQNFNQSLIAIEYLPDQLNSEKVLLELIERLDEAEKKGDVVLMTPHIMEFLWAYLKKECLAVNPSPTKINLMADLCNVQREKGDVLADEVDQLLNLGYAVDIPGNEPKKLKPERILLVEEIYKYFNSDTLMINGQDGKKRPVREIINLSENKQKSLTTPEFQEIFSAITQELAKKFRSLRLHRHPKLHSAFTRFATNAINPELQRYLDFSDKFTNEINALEGPQKEDFLFLQYFKKLKSSLRSEEKEAADEIALLRHLYKDIFTTAFSEDAGRNFGRLGIDIVPYEGAGNPSITEIGYHYRKLILWFQNLYNFPPQTAQLKYFADKMRQKGEHEVLKTKKLLNDTPAGIEFLQTTGIRLSEIDNPTAIESAVKFVQSDPLRIHALRVEREIAAEKVTYYPERYTANGLALTWLSDTFRAFSGTPWNYLTYTSDLIKNIILDVGTEGSIIDKLFQRENKGEIPIHKITNNDPENILAKVLDNNPNKEKIVGFLDGGADFKHISPNNVPARIWKFYNPNPDENGKTNKPIQRPINHIFYLHHPGGSGTPIPCVYSESADGTPTRTFLEGTRLEDFQKAKVDNHKCFFLINEKGCTGTDVTQPDDAINIVSLDETMLRRTFFQVVFRLRKILFKQNIEIVINTASAAKIDQSGSTLRGQMNTLIKNQAVELTKRIDEAFQYKADFAIESAIINHFVLEPRKKGKVVKPAKLRPYQDFLRTTVQDNPSEDFGRLEYMVNTKKDLEGYALDKLNKLKQIRNTPQKLIDTVQKQIDDLIVEIKASEYLAAQKPSKEAKGLNVQTTVVQQTNRTTNTERTVEVNQEIKTELNRYNIYTDEQFITESRWKTEEMESLLQNPLKYKQLHTLHDALDENKSKLTFRYSRPYKNIFGNYHFATENFLHTQTNILPIFHRGFKRFQQILFIETRTGMVSIQLSKKEAVQFINHLSKNTQYPNVWIVNSDGKPYYDNSNPLPNTADVRQTLVEANAANGNMSYLDAHDEDTSIWMNTSCTHETPCICFNTKQNFVALKVNDKPLQNEIFTQSEIFHPNLNATAGQRLRLNPASIAEIDSPDEIELLKNDQVNHLSHLPVLNLDELQTYYLTEQQIGWLNKPELIATLTPQQFEHLSPSQMRWIDPKQVSWIGSDEKRIHALVAPLLDSLTAHQLTFILDEQVEEIQLEDTLARLNDEKKQHITEKQVGLITHTNLLQSLPQDKWKWINASQVTADIVTDDLIPHLENEAAIQALPINKLHLVPLVLRHKYISDEQLQVVHTNLTVFHSLDKALIKRIHDKVAIENFSQDFLPHMDQNDYINLSEAQIRLITDKEVLQKLPFAKVQHVALDQIEKLNYHRRAFTNHQFDFLSQTQIQSLKNQKFFTYLNRDGIAHLNKEQLALITEPKVMSQVIPYITDKELIKHLNSEQIRYVAKEKLIQIPEERWPELTEDQLRHWEIKQKVISLVQKSSFSTFVDLPKKMRAYGTFAQNFFGFTYRTITGLISTPLSILALFTPIFWFRNSFTKPLWNFISRPVRRLFS